jgi:hypothetical protein
MYSISRNVMSIDSGGINEHIVVGIVSCGRAHGGCCYWAYHSVCLGEKKCRYYLRPDTRRRRVIRKKGSLLMKWGDLKKLIEENKRVSDDTPIGAVIVEGEDTNIHVSISNDGLLDVFGTNRHI